MNVSQLKLGTFLIFWRPSPLFGLIPKFCWFFDWKASLILSFFSCYIWAMVNVRLVNLSHGKCEFGKYELLYSCSMVNLRVVNLLFGTNELAAKCSPWSFTRSSFLRVVLKKWFNANHFTIVSYWISIFSPICWALNPPNLGWHLQRKFWISNMVGYRS